MMTMLPAPATPLPWKAKRSWEDYIEPDTDEMQEYMARPYTRIEEASIRSRTVVTAHDCFTFTPGDAEYIVTACNALPALVAALEKIIHVTSNSTDTASSLANIEATSALKSLYRKL